MQFFAVATLFAAAAVAAPTPQTTNCPNSAQCATNENIDISDYYLRKNNGIQAVSFKLSGNNATDVSCSIGATTTLPSEVVTCGESDYRFGLVEPTDTSSDVGLAIYHQTAPFVGKWGTGSVPTYCHAGGNGPDDFVCQQVSSVTIVIQ